MRVTPLNPLCSIVSGVYMYIAEEYRILHY